jgi:hypothetical protein
MIKTMAIPPIPFKNRVEELAYQELDKIFNPDILLYEAIKLTSPGGTYVPDFILPIGQRLLLVEVKSSWSSPGASRTKRSMKEIAQTYAFLGYFIVMLPEKQHQKDRIKYVDMWRYEIVEPGNNFRRTTVEEIKDKTKE